MSSKFIAICPWKSSNSNSIYDSSMFLPLTLKLVLTLQPCPTFESKPISESRTWEKKFLNLCETVRNFFIFDGCQCVISVRQVHPVCLIVIVVVFGIQQAEKKRNMDAKAARDAEAARKRADGSARQRYEAWYAWIVSVSWLRNHFLVTLISFYTRIISILNLSIVGNFNELLSSF